MKKKLLSLCAILFMGASPLSQAFTLADNTDVGDLDIFVAATTQAAIGNASMEQAWVESVLGMAVTIEDKTEPVPLFTTQESATVIAFALATAPGYYIVKDSTDYVLFDNQISMDWGVVDLAQYFGVNKLEDLTFSHVTEFNGGPVDVPEPGSSMLLGAGLLSLYLMRRRSRKQNAV